MSRSAMIEHPQETLKGTAPVRDRPPMPTEGSTVEVVHTLTSWGSTKTSFFWNIDPKLSLLKSIVDPFWTFQLPSGHERIYRTEVVGWGPMVEASLRVQGVLAWRAPTAHIVEQKPIATGTGFDLALLGFHFSWIPFASEKLGGLFLFGVPIGLACGFSILRKGYLIPATRYDPDIKPIPAIVFDPAEPDPPITRFERIAPPREPKAPPETGVSGWVNRKLSASEKRLNELRATFHAINEEAMETRRQRFEEREQERIEARLSRKYNPNAHIEKVIEKIEAEHTQQEKAQQQQANPEPVKAEQANAEPAKSEPAKPQA